MKWFATFGVCASAFVVSFSVEMSMEPQAFYGFFIAHVVWIVAALAMRDKPLIALNVFFLFVDIYAIIIRL